MSANTEVLFSNSWNVRVSDPGEEGSLHHLFETVCITLEAHTVDGKTSYEFTRKVEDRIKVHQTFANTTDLFGYLGNYLSPVALGEVGVKIGKLGLA